MTAHWTYTFFFFYQISLSESLGGGIHPGYCLFPECGDSDRLSESGSVRVRVAGQVVLGAKKMLDEANNFCERNSAVGTEKCVWELIPAS